MVCLDVLSEADSTRSAGPHHKFQVLYSASPGDSYVEAEVSTRWIAGCVHVDLCVCV